MTIILSVQTGARYALTSGGLLEGSDEQFTERADREWFDSAAVRRLHEP